jgi:capsule polysaccharide export protein KpsE/RkpR
VNATLEEAEKKFSQFASQKGAIDVPTQGKAMVTAAATLQGQLIASESELQGLRQI